MPSRPHPGDPVDHVMEAVRGTLESRRKAALERVATVRAAVDAYLEALEREALKDILNRVGGGAPSPEGPSARQAAKLLRAAVDALPELSEKKPKEPKKAPPPPPPATAPARATGGSGLTSKLPLPATMRLRGGEAKAPKPAPAAAHATLLAASRRRKFVIVGGLRKRDKLDALTAVLGFSPEWVETEGAAANAIRGVEGRILDGRIAGVVCLEGIMSHTQVEPLVRATRQTGIAFAYADRGGKASLDRAFEELEEALSDEE